MNKVISVREFARLTTEVVEASLDRAQVSPSAFDYLCQLNASFSRAGVGLVQVEGRRWLRLDNYVGVLQTPCGTTLEVLPKHHNHTDSLTDCRALLRKMIQATLDLPTRDVGSAPLELFDAPLSEWVMQRFLGQLDLLVKRGLRFEYQRVEDETPFLRGQWNVMAQMRQPPGKDHRFHIRHDIYSPDRAENRLLRLALDRVRQATQEPENWRLAQELSFRLTEVPPSQRLRDDFRAWGTDRLMAHYQAVKPWCELILNRHMPLSVLGEQFGLSLLFPMEKLFERYVAAWLRRQVASRVDIRTPASSESLCLHDGRPIFRLEPDVLLSGVSGRWVMDTKWKRLDAGRREDKYGLSQADFYQLFAYGQKYLGGQGQMALVFPKTESFGEPLAPFDFRSGLTLHVLPFDLDADRLIGWEVLGIPTRSNAALAASIDCSAKGETMAKDQLEQDTQGCN